VKNLTGRGVTIVGASAGIGRALAVQAVRAGADVVLTARRERELKDAVAQAGGGHAVVADLCEPEDRRRLVEETARLLPQIDLAVVAVGMAPLGPIAAASDEDWDAVLRTNVVSINRYMAELGPHLAPDALVAVCSTESVGQPRWGLGAYAASKAAIEESLRAWRLEYPGVRFTCAAVGATVPTDFGATFDRPTLEAAFEHWEQQGIGHTGFMGTDELATALLDTLAAVLPHPGIGLEHLLLRAPSPLPPATGPTGTAEAPATARPEDAS
jgi:NAD(P)-dependent dehydrogenase (short-subunit alcohol dehydrogenase family)